MHPSLHGSMVRNAYCSRHAETGLHDPQGPDAGANHRERA